MTVDPDQLAEQVDLAYAFIDALHGQVVALIKDVEAQLARTCDVHCLRPGGYGYYTNALSTSLERPQTQLADYFAVYLRAFESAIENTPFAGGVPPIAFLKVVLREDGLTHPEVRFGVLTDVRQQPGRPEEKFEDVAYRLTERAFSGPPWVGRGDLAYAYDDAYVAMHVEGRGVRLADLPDSEAVARRIVDPLVAMFPDLPEDTSFHRSKR
jgi:hypothetical protein